MQTILIIIQIILALFIIAIILLQRNSSDELQGLGGSSSNLGGIMTSATSINFMTKLTAILVAIFMINCLVLGNLAASHSKSSVVSQIETEAIENTETKKEEQRNLPIAE